MAGICFCALTALMASHRCWALSESEFLRTSRTILDSTAKASVATVTVFAVVNVANMIFQALIHTLKTDFEDKRIFVFIYFLLSEWAVAQRARLVCYLKEFSSFFKNRQNFIKTAKLTSFERINGRNHNSVYCPLRFF